MDIFTNTLSSLHNGAVNNRLTTAMGLPKPARPEDMFLAWYFSLAESADVAAAARSEVERLDAVAAPCEETARLRALLLQATMPAMPRQGRRRQRH